MVENDTPPATETQTAEASAAGGILAFGPRPPVRLWQAHGLNCAVYWGSTSFNGYVQLPPGHVDRVLAEAAAAVLDCAGYDTVAANATDALTGGLTYGPDEQGWVGFDTGHYNDDWPDTEIEQNLQMVDPLTWVEFCRQRDYMVSVGVPWPPGRALGATRIWTMPRLVAVVESLARILADTTRTTEEDAP